MFVLLCRGATGGANRGGAGLPAEELKSNKEKSPIPFV